MAHVRRWPSTNATSRRDLLILRAATPPASTIMDSPKPNIAIISPALRSANNGNWQTAYRWSRFLRAVCDVSLGTEWSPGDHPDKLPACMIALHARRSAGTIARFADASPDRPLLVGLTGPAPSRHTPFHQSPPPPPVPSPPPTH